MEMRPTMMTGSVARAELLRRHRDSFTRLLHKVERGDERAIHRTRVTSRRLRELLPVLELEPATCAKVLRDLKRATQALGRIRELDVTLRLIEALRTEVEEADASWSLLVQQLRQARLTTHTKATRKGHLSDDLRRLGKRLDRLVHEATPALQRGGKRWHWALDARVVRRAEALRHAVKEAGPFYLPERLHDVRIALKKLRYALELQAQAARKQVGPELRLLKRGQALLGVLHDRQILIERLREAQSTLSASDRRTSAELDRLIAWLEDDCRGLHAKFVRQRPRLMDACTRLAPVAAAPGTPATQAKGSRRSVASR